MAGNDWRQYALFIVIIIAVIWLLIRLRGRPRNPQKLRVAMEVIANVNDDLKLLTQKVIDPADMKKFKTGNWQAYQTNLDFIDPPAVEALKKAFKTMTEYNIGIELIKKAPGSPQPALDSEPLKESLNRGRAGLAKWIRENLSKESSRGLFTWR